MGSTSTRYEYDRFEKASTRYEYEYEQFEKGGTSTSGLKGAVRGTSTSTSDFSFADHWLRAKILRYSCSARREEAFGTIFMGVSKKNYMEADS